MRRFSALASAFVLAAGLSACSTGLASEQAGYTVKINTENSHGSGVHIGDGLIVTAAHVVEHNTNVGIVDDRGGDRIATVLWKNDQYDIALVKIDHAETLTQAHLSCTSPVNGQIVTAEGNPRNLDFITASGRIAGGARKYGPWRSVVVTDMTTIPGMSGGPVLSGAGEVVAITVGVMVGGVSPGVAVPERLGFAVPGAVVCELMGRTS